MLTLDEKLAQLKSRAAEGKTSVIQPHVVDHLFGEIERLRDSIKDAGTSLNTIGDTACLDGTMLEYGDQIRGYARNRATVALIESHRGEFDEQVAETGQRRVWNEKKAASAAAKLNRPRVR